MWFFSYKGFSLLFHPSGSLLFSTSMEVSSLILLLSCSCSWELSWPFSMVPVQFSVMCHHTPSHTVMCKHLSFSSSLSQVSVSFFFVPTSSTVVGVAALSCTQFHNERWYNMNCTFCCHLPHECVNRAEQKMTKSQMEQCDQWRSNIDLFLLSS